MWGGGGIAPPFLTLALDETRWSASRPYSFTLGNKALGTDWIWCWVSIRARVNHMGKRKLFFPCREWNRGCPARSLVAVPTEIFRRSSHPVVNKGNHIWSVCSRIANIVIRCRDTNSTKLTPNRVQGTRSSVVGWGTMLQAGRSRVRFPIKLLHFTIDLILPAWPWGGLGVWQKWVLGGKQPYRRLSANCLENVGASTSHNPRGLHSMLQEYIYLFIGIEFSDGLLQARQ
jgi:hypothetical protein